jgi:hypothetical protein
VTTVVPGHAEIEGTVYEERHWLPSNNNEGLSAVIIPSFVFED